MKRCKWRYTSTPVPVEERTRCQVCLHPPHTRPHTPTQSQWTPGPCPTPLGTLCVHRPCQGYTHNPTGLSVHSQGCTWNPTGISMPSQGYTPRQPSTRNHDAPLNLSPPSRVLCFYTRYHRVLEETAQLSMCARQVRDSILLNFGRLVAYLCRVVSLRQ